MTRTAWRIVKTKHLEGAFSGDGARRFGGRFNSVGTRMVYASATVSLAILEVLIHLDTDALLAAYSLCRVEFDESFMTRIDPGVLPENWREYPAPRDLQMMGDRWIEAQSSVVLEVPSVISPNESNFLLNADHPHFVKIVIGAPQPFSFDRRIRR